MITLAPDILAHDADGKDGDVETMPAHRTAGVSAQQATLKDAVVLLERSFGLSRGELANVLGIDRHALARWAKSDTISPHAPSKTEEKFLALLVLNVHLSDLFETPEDARTWLHRPLPFLGNVAPIDAVKAGRIESVDAALEAIDEGFAS